MCKRTLLSVPTDFTLLSFQGALRIAIKAPGLIVEYPIWILALSPLSLLSFRSDPIPLPACWLGARSFLLLITVLWLLLMYIFLKHSFSRSLPAARVAVPGGRTRGAPGAPRGAGPGGCGPGPGPPGSRHRCRPRLGAPGAGSPFAPAGRRRLRPAPSGSGAGLISRSLHGLSSSSSPPVFPTAHSHSRPPALILPPCPPFSACICYYY